MPYFLTSPIPGGAHWRLLSPCLQVIVLLLAGLALVVPLLREEVLLLLSGARDREAADAGEALGAIV